VFLSGLTKDKEKAIAITIKGIVSKLNDHAAATSPITGSSNKNVTVAVMPSAFTQYKASPRFRSHAHRAMASIDRPIISRLNNTGSVNKRIVNI